MPVSFRDGAEARNGALRRSRRLDGARRERRPGGRPLAAERVLRPGRALHHRARRHRREVRRRRRDGRLRRARSRTRTTPSGRCGRRSAIVDAVVSSGSRCGSGSSRARSSRTRTRPPSRPDGRSTRRHGCSRRPSPGEVLLGPRCRAADARHRRHDAARRAGGTRLPGRGRGVAGRLGLGGCRSAARRLGPVRRARGGARAAPQHVRARRARPARAPRDRLRGRRRRQVATRARVRRRRRARRRSSRAAASRTAKASRTGRSRRW